MTRRVMDKGWYRMAAIVVGMVVCLGVQAQSLPNLQLRVVSYQETVQFKSLQQMVVTTRTEREALTDSGAQQMTKHTYGFNGALETIELVEAYTLKKSGEKIPLAKEGLTRQKGYVSSGVGITVPEWEVHQIAFPSLSVGDKTVIHSRRTINKAPLEGWLSYSDYLWPSIEIQKAQWRIEAPAEMALTVRSTVQGAQQPVLEAGVKVWQFNGATSAKAIDSNPTSTRVAVPYVLASTVAQHEEVGRLFARQVQAKAYLNDGLKALAAQITQGLTNDKDKSRAIYDWVRKNLKYTAIYMSNGGWEPHDTDHILKTRYGDCKDHVTLMYALLKQVGVQAQPVLISVNNEFQPDPIPVAGSYNHTILYLPSLKKYLDPTASQTPFDGMSWALSSRPVTRSDGQHAQLDRTPVISPQDNTSSVHTTVTVAADGSARMQIEHKVTGISAAAAHERLTSYRQEYEAAEVNRVLNGSGYSGSGQFSHTPINRDVLEQTMRWDVAIKNFMSDPQAGATSVHPGLNLHTHIVQYMGSYMQDRREFSALCGAYRVQETFHISFDPRFDILRVPKGLELEKPGVRFRSSVERQSNTLQGQREMVFDHDSLECSPAEYERHRALMNQITRHMRSPVLFTQLE